MKRREFLTSSLALCASAIMVALPASLLDRADESAKLQAAISTDEHPLCAVCSIETDSATAPKSVYKGRNYFFCSIGHKQKFDAAPNKFL